jgi:tetratricopeptide (TPR) repeat protein/tRNA A-37 threonylcarbamoyl transferase component Bud32
MPDTTPFEHPERIGPYHILKVIGEGGMGLVYEAEQSEPVQRRVALKMIKIGMDTKEVVARFEAERQALAVMEHPGIAKVFDAGATEQGRPFFVMELVRGVRLDEYCDREHLTTRQRAELFVSVCDAVQHAHQKGVIHRDLKPSNVLVSDEDGHPMPKVIDFGIAKATGQELTDRTALTADGQAIGTLAYMSPEQAETGGLDVDTRTDIYSLGIVLYELLSGSVPLDPSKMGMPAFLARLVEPDLTMPTLSNHVFGLARDELEALAKQRGTTAGRLGRQLGEDLQWIVFKAIEKDRDHRYGTASGLAMDLRRYLTDEPVTARPPAALYRARKFFRRNRAGVLAGAAAALALLLGTTVSTLAMFRALRAEEVARQEAETATQVSDFLEGVFSVNDPSEARGNTITARELLEAGAARIGTELADQTAVQARLMATMGRVFEGLGLMDQGEELLRNSLNTIDEDPATAPDLKPQVLSSLGAVLAERGLVEEADSLLAEAVGLWSSMEDEGLRHARALYQLGYHRAVFLGDRKAADSLVLHAIAIQEDILGPDHPTVGESLSMLAYFHDDDPEFAEPIQRRVLGIYDETYGWNDTRTLSQGNDLFLTLLGSGAFDEAETLMRRVVDGIEVVYGNDHPALASARMDLSLLYTELARHAEAVELLDPAVETFVRAYGERAPETAYARQLLAVSLLELGRLAEAEEYATASAGDLEASLGRTHNWTAQALAALGLLRLRQDRPEEAEPLLRETISTQEGNWGPDHRILFEPLVALGSLLILGERWDAADSAYARALEICQSARLPTHPCVGKAAEGYSTVLRARGLTLEADSVARLGGSPDSG